MALSESNTLPRVKSWWGLTFGLAAVAVSIGAWVQSGNWTHLVGAAGFGCWAFVWSQIPFPLSTSLRKLRAAEQQRPSVHSIVTYVGLALVALSLALRWLL